MAKVAKKTTPEGLIVRFCKWHGLTIVRWDNMCDVGRVAVVNDGDFYVGTLAANTGYAYWVD